MFYLKTYIKGMPAKIEINADEIYTQCFNCGKEIEVDTEMLKYVLEEGDLYSTQISCCVTQTKLTRIK